MASPPPAFWAVLEDRFTPRRELGGGAMATVWVAHDRRHDRPVVVKVFDATVGALLGRERFLREIAILARLQHPNILPLLDSGEAAGLLFHVTPYVAGESLRSRLSRDTQLELPTAIRLAGELADALGFAHRQGIIHRDLKPENVLLSADHALLADFGISLSAAAEQQLRTTAEHAPGERTEALEDSLRLTGTGIALGTPLYMSPEQAGGTRAADARSDLYALGCVLFEMLVGRPPFTGANLRELVSRHIMDPMPSMRAQRPEVPASLEAVLRRTLAKEPSARFQTADEFGRALREASPERFASEVSAGRGRRRRQVAIAVVAALAGIVAMLALPRKGRAPLPVTHRQISFRGDVQQPAISGDGRFASFLANDTLWVVDLATGVERALASVSTYPWLRVTQAWSVDGSRVIVGQRGGVIEYPLDGSAAARASFDTIRTGNRYASFVFDSGAMILTAPHVVFHGSRVLLRRQELIVEGSSSQYLLKSVSVPDGYWIDRASVSRDGRRAVLAARDAFDWRTGATRLLLADFITGTLDSLPLATGWTIGGVAWSPSGRNVLVARLDEGEEGLHALSVDPGARPKVRAMSFNLMAGIPVADFSLARGARRVAYTRSANSFMLNAFPLLGDVTRRRLLAEGPGERRSLAVDPSGSKLAFVLPRGRQAGVYTVDLSTGEAHLIGPGLGDAEALAWSADGGRLAFLRVRSADSGTTAATLDVRNGAVEAIPGVQLRGAVPGGGEIAWLRDGSGILAVDVDLENTAPGSSFGLVELSFKGERRMLIPHRYGRIQSPVVSPDGWSVAVELEDFRSALHIVDRRMPSKSRSVPGGRNMYPIAWTPRGLFTVRFDEGVPSLVRLDPASGAVLQRQQLPSGCSDVGVIEARAELVCLGSAANDDLWIADNLDVDPE